MEIWLTMRSVVWWMVNGLYRAWKLNPINLFLRRMRTMYRLDAHSDLPIKPKWTERIRDVFISDVQRKIRLLQWVRSRVSHVTVDDFIYSWQDGIALCALLESVCPGVCPRFFLLKSDLRVNNCRFGLKIAYTFLGIQQIILTPEEMAIADQSTELKIVHLVQMIRWKHQRMSKTTCQQPRAVTAPVRRILSRCFARGTGLKTGTVGRRAKFNIFTDCNGVVDILVEIRGPEGEMNSEKISSLHPDVPPDPPSDNNNLKPPSPEPRSRVISDDRGNTFMRQKSFDESTNQVIPFDYQSVGEGRFLVSYVPRNPGVHIVVIKSHDHHIQGSPFDVPVSSWTSSWNIVGKNKVVDLSTLPSVDKSPDKKSQLEAVVSNRFLEAGSHRARRRIASSSKQLTVSKRRVLKRVITKNGEEILLSDYTPSPTISRQSSADVSDLSEEEHGRKLSTGSSRNVPLVDSNEKLRNEMAKQWRCHKLPIKDEIYVPCEETSCDTSESFSTRSADSSIFKTNDSSTLWMKDNRASKQSNSESETVGISKHDNPGHEMTRIPFHRSFSDSFAMDRDILLKEEAADDGRNETAALKESPVLKVLLSGTPAKMCAYISDHTKLESNYKPHVSANANEKNAVDVVIKPRPKLAQIQKMSRKWQSVDSEVLCDGSAQVNKNTSIVVPCTQGPFISSAEIQVEQENANENNVSKYRSSALSKESSSGHVTQSVISSFCSTVGTHSKSENSYQPEVIIPCVQVDKTTQVSSEDIKTETGWHSGAFKIKKRRICLNSGNIRPASSLMPLESDDVSSDSRGVKGEPLSYWINAPTDGDKPNFNGVLGERGPNHEKYNVQQWLLNNGQNRFRISADRESTTDTNDSGIADESNHSLSKGHQRISRRGYPREFKLDPGLIKETVNIRDLGWLQYPQRSLCTSLMEHWEEKDRRESLNDEPSCSDSELEYGLHMLQMRSRIRLKNKEWHKCRKCVDSSKRERMNQKEIVRELGQNEPGTRAGHGKKLESNGDSPVEKSRLSRSVSFSSYLCDGLACFDSNRKESERSARGSRSSHTSQRAFDETFVTDSPLQDAQETDRVICPDEHLEEKHEKCGIASSLTAHSHNKTMTDLNGSVEGSRSMPGQSDIPSDNETTYVLKHTITRQISPLSFNVSVDTGMTGYQTGLTLHDTSVPLEDPNTESSETGSTARGMCMLSSDSGMASNDRTSDGDLIPSARHYKTARSFSLDDTAVDALYDSYFSSKFLLEDNPFAEIEADQLDRLPGHLEDEEDCLVFGSGLTYGHVGITNNFQVWVRHPSNGSVNVSIYGPKPHCVTETTTTYTGDNLYEVMYEVTHPGYYIISVKWGNDTVPNSPFIAKIAFND